MANQLTNLEIIRNQIKNDVDIIKELLGDVSYPRKIEHIKIRYKLKRIETINEFYGIRSHPLKDIKYIYHHIIPFEYYPTIILARKEYINKYYQRLGLEHKNILGRIQLLSYDKEYYKLYKRIRNYLNNKIVKIDAKLDRDMKYIAKIEERLDTISIIHKPKRKLCYIFKENLKTFSYKIK